MRNINVQLFKKELNIQGVSPINTPVYATTGSAGADIYANLKEPVVLQPGDSAMIPTGVFIAIPEGYEAQVRPRSGLAAKHQVTTVNSPGTIDSDYRGEIFIILINHGKNPFTVNHQDRIAQLVFAKVTQANFQVVNQSSWNRIAATERGTGGFGSTGLKKVGSKPGRRTLRQKIFRFFRIGRK